MLKEIKVANRTFWLGLLATVLVLGMAVLGCDNGTITYGSPPESSDIDGTWISSNTIDGTNYMKIVASKGNFLQYVAASKTSDTWKEVAKGTYPIYAKSPVTVTVTQINTIMFGGPEVWKTWANLDPDYKAYMDTDTWVITINNNQFTTNGITFDNQRTLVITGLTEDLLSKGTDNGYIALFPTGTTLSNVTADFMSYLSGRPIQYATAGNDFDSIDNPVLTQGTYTVTIPFYRPNQTPWSGSGTFDIYEYVSDGVKRYIYKIPNVSISSSVTTVSASNIVYVNEEFLSIKGTITLTNIPSGQPRIWVNIRGVKDNGWIWQNNGAGENGVNYSSGTTNLPWVAHIKNLEWAVGSGDLFPATLEFWIYAIYNNNESNPLNYGKYIYTGIRIGSMEEAMTTPINIGTVDFTKNEF